MSPSPSVRAGFTLIELLVVVVIAGLLGTTVLSLFRHQSSSFRKQSRSVEVEQNLRAGADLIVRELRNAGIKDSARTYAIAPGIVAADSTTIRFRQDTDGSPDGDVADSNEDLAYSYSPSDSTLRRTDYGSGDSTAYIMARFVTRVRFTYYDAANSQMPLPIGAATGSIHRIGVSVTAAAADSPPRTLESDVVPPNLAY